MGHQPLLRQLADGFDHRIGGGIQRAVPIPLDLHEPGFLQLSELATEVRLAEARALHQRGDIIAAIADLAHQTQPCRFAEQPEKATELLHHLRGELADGAALRRPCLARHPPSYADTGIMQLDRYGSMDVLYWDQRYREEGFAYGDQPNDFLREQAAELPVGDAFCLAEGEGRNAVHLAALGHHVTAQDLSAVGLDKAQALAESRGLSLMTQQGDLADWRPEPGSVDLVVAIWMHLPPPLRAQVLAASVCALRPGGVLLLEAYTPRQLGLGSGGPPSLDLLVEPDQLERELSGLRLEILRECRRLIREGRYHQGESAVVQLRGRKI